MIIAIDPGAEQSAILGWDGSKIQYPEIIVNDKVLTYLKNLKLKGIEVSDLYIEQVKSYGMAVGDEIFETCVWTGRFYQTWKELFSKDPIRIPRKTVVTHHCMSSKGSDSNVRKALIDRFGKKGTKKKPGSTYGLKEDLWAAFSLATYAWDIKKGTEK